MRPSIAVVAVSLAVASCGSDSPSAGRGADLTLETVARSSYSGFSAAERTVIDSAEQWALLWAELNAGLRPMPPLPAVDFSRQSLFLAAAGTRANGCYSIDITSARATGDGGVALEVTETVPGSSCACTQAVTRPVHVVRIGSPTREAVFGESQRRQRC
jgi:hypothetical protein